MASQPKRAPAVIKAVQILEFVTRSQPASFTSIYEALDLPKSSAYVLINTMIETGLLRQTIDGQIMLGLRLYELGNSAISHLDVQREALPYLRALKEQVQLTCHFGILEGLEAIYLLKVECSQAIIPNTWEGKRLSLHSSSLGKVLMAWKEEQELDRILKSIDFVAKTPKTITDPQIFREELKLVAQRGWASDDGEDVVGVRCIAAPVRDSSGKVVGGVSIVGMVSQLRQRDLERLSVSLTEKVGEMSAALGYRALS